MSTILTIYSYNAFKRFLLPAISDADYSILLSESLFNIRKNTELKLENRDGEWYFVPGEDYKLEYLSSGEDCCQSPIREDAENGQNKLKLLIDGKHVISIIVRVTEDYFSEFYLYRLKGISGHITIGREESNTISANPSNLNLLSGTHAILSRRGTEFVFQDNNSANGSYINNVKITSSKELAFGDCIDTFGLRLVFLGDVLAVNVMESGAIVDGTILRQTEIDAPPLEKVNRKSLSRVFHRSPRYIARIDTEPVKIDEPPAPKEEVKQRAFLAVVGGALSMSLPMLLGCSFMLYASRISGMGQGLFMYVGLVTAVTSAVIGTMRSLSGMKEARKEYEAYETFRNEKYGAYLKEQETLIRNKYEKNMGALRDRYKSAAECCEYTAENAELWSRNVNQADFLVHRLGLGNLPFQASIEIPEKRFSMVDNNLQEAPRKIKEAYETLQNVPVCVDLLKERLIGIIGGKHMAGGISVVQNLIIQLAMNNAYTEVKMVLIYDDKKSGTGNIWNFVTWLPHVWNETKTFRYVASNKEEASDVFFELNKVLRQRKESVRPDTTGTREKISLPYYILIIVNPELLEGELIYKYILEPETTGALTTLYMTERYEELPNECDFIIENDDQYRGMYHVSDDIEERMTIRFDTVTPLQLSHFSSNIANVEVREIESGGDVPNSISFFEMYGIRKLEELNVLSRWKKNRTYESMKALVGQKSGGVPCYLDIHEKYHGPHGLVAGTTGSGKSETLQTYILSLAINFSPDDVGFFIIDYKGGGMANLFENLPHMVGQISNLSGNQVQRALVSIQSEKDRREALFRDYGVKDIRDYTKLYKNYEATTPLPHLIIVIDEFAEMKQEEPEFIQEIVSVSRVGRSLGIHLIMATQKPAGSVSEDIWSNSRFKLCLRVQSKQDSMDMLHKPDAAYLTQSGRTWLQVGNDELYELFQSGYSGAVYNEDEDELRTDVAKLLDIDGVPSIEGNHARYLRQKEKKIEWIRLLLRSIASVAGENPAVYPNLSRERKLKITADIFQELKRQNCDYPETEHNRENLITLIDQITKYGFDAKRIVEAEAAFTNTKEKLPQQPERTQLEAVVSYLKQTALKNGYTHDFSLFLPVLPTDLYLTSLPQSAYPWNRSTVFNGTGWPDHAGRWALECSLGLYDDPENQRQDTYGLNLANAGNILVFGSATTGKSTFLQTFVYGLVNRYSPAEVNFYIMEFSARRFSAFEEAPQIGGIIHDNDDNEKIDKFFTMMMRLLNERKHALGDLSFEQYVASKRSMPAVIVVIDNFASFVNRTGEHYNAFLAQLSKEGISNGIFFAVSAGGTGSGEMPNSLAQNFRTVVCLELNNIYDYANYLRTSHFQIRPEAGIRGRGIAFVEGRILEFQTALSVQAENDATVSGAIRDMAYEMNRVWKGHSARQIPEIPEEPVWELFRASDDVEKMAEDESLLPIGYDARYAEPYAVDLSGIYTFIATGAKKKGKTNFLKAAMLSASMKKARIVVIDYANQFERICTEIGAERISSETQWYEWLKAFLPEISKRNQEKYEMIQKGTEEKDIFLQMQKYEQVFFFIDHLPDFVHRVYHPTEKIPQTYDSVMESILDKGTLHNMYWFGTVDKEEMGIALGSRLFKLFIREKKGIHFGGLVHSTAIAEHNFENHDRRSADSVKPVGKGMLPGDNETSVREVVIPQVKGI